MAYTTITHLVDPNDVAIELGSYMLDGRGKVWRVLETPQSFRNVGMFSTVEVRWSASRKRWLDTGTETYGRAYASFVVQPDDMKKPERERSVIYRRMVAEFKERTGKSWLTNNDGNRY